MSEDMSSAYVLDTTIFKEVKQICKNASSAGEDMRLDMMAMIELMKRIHKNAEAISMVDALANSQDDTLTNRVREQLKNLKDFLNSMFEDLDV